MVWLKVFAESKPRLDVNNFSFILSGYADGGCEEEEEEEEDHHSTELQGEDDDNLDRAGGGGGGENFFPYPSLEISFRPQFGPSESSKVELASPPSSLVCC